MLHKYRKSNKILDRTSYDCIFLFHKMEILSSNALLT